MPRSLRALAAALVLGAGLLAAPAAAPTPVAGVGPLPPCRYDDILTDPIGYDDGPVTLVDTMLMVGDGYRPPDLVAVSKAGVGGGGLVREIALADLTAMAKAAKANGTPLKSLSAYRSYKTQVALFGKYASGYGFGDAVTFSARPGHSEHQLGLTIDFGAVGDTRLTSNWEVTRTGKWMAGNAWKYGWMMSYPKGTMALTCYSYEPWHYRYVGRDAAAAIHEAGLTPREYLWANYTNVTVAACEPQPTPLATPLTLVCPTPTPEVPATPAPSATPAATPGQPTAGISDRPADTAPPTSETGTGSALDPPVIVAGTLLALASVGLIGSFLIRRSRRG
jgi:D-alanyl-D-alanine carboxypeptidase